MLRTTIRAMPLSLALVLFVCVWASQGLAVAQEGAAEQFRAVRDDPVLLRRFLSDFPKGADLHNHIDGAVYAENLIKWASEDGKCVELASGSFTLPPCSAKDRRPTVSSIQFDDDIVNSIIDALSTRNYECRPVSGHNQFFSTFEKIMPATFGREGDMLAEVSARAARQNLQYLELMQSWAMGDAIALAVQDSGIGVGQPLERRSLP